MCIKQLNNTTPTKFNLLGYTAPTSFKANKQTNKQKKKGTRPIYEDGWAKEKRGGFKQDVEQPVGFNLMTATPTVQRGNKK